MQKNAYVYVSSIRGTHGSVEIVMKVAFCRTLTFLSVKFLKIFLQNLFPVRWKLFSRPIHDEEVFLLLILFVCLNSSVHSFAKRSRITTFPFVEKDLKKKHPLTFKQI